MDDGEGSPDAGARDGVNTVVAFVGGNADGRRVPMTPDSGGALPEIVKFMGSTYTFDTAELIYRSTSE